MLINMATKELFIKEILSDEIVAAGRRLLQRLDAQQADVRCAFWFLMEEERQWKMVLVSPLVDSSGPRDFYKRVMKANKEAEEQEKVIALGHIVASVVVK
jgi:protein-tyrosine phosphatase